MAQKNFKRHEDNYERLPLPPQELRDLVDDFLEYGPNSYERWPSRGSRSKSGVLKMFAKMCADYTENGKRVSMMRDKLPLGVSRHSPNREPGLYEGKLYRMLRGAGKATEREYQVVLNLTPEGVKKVREKYGIVDTRPRLFADRYLQES